ncbi:Hypothetical protein NCS54_01093700 [Fusarium falciforme]|uniref:Hypothetical protein n=1 Tax=Fusarium falciforme TaxID=195108 RepID=UPI002301F32A|nr:Hypothetical protein NCS54_01093700 [Fusarium falciforme]WAO93390.1 Hypothetical protein NCS54_01093700 [Fusarium falciforme]
MKISTVLSLGAAILPLASAECNYHDMGWFNKKWRLATFKSKNCINKTGDWTRKGFGTWCIDIPNNTKSFIFNVGGGYNPANLEDCTIFFKTKSNCGGKTKGRSRGEWKKKSLENKVAGAYVQCTRLVNKRDAEEKGPGERKFIRDDDGQWFEELEDGEWVNVEVVANDDEGEIEETEDA